MLASLRDASMAPGGMSLRSTPEAVERIERGAETLADFTPVNDLTALATGKTLVREEPRSAVAATAAYRSA